MADDIKVNASADVSAPSVATDDVGGKHYQKIKAGWGADGTWVETDDASTKRMPVNVAESAIVGIVTETAPASDTASSGLNGRLQRVAQRLTSLIALLPASLGAKAAASSFAVTQSTEDAAQLGSLTETAPASDTASSGLNGRLQRIAQRLTSLIALLPTSLGTGGGLVGESVSRSATITVANAATVSTTSVDTNGARNLGIVVDAAFDGTQITFQVSYDNSTFVVLRDVTNTVVTQTVTAGCGHDLVGELMAWRYIKVVTVTTQTGASNFVFMMRS